MKFTDFKTIKLATAPGTGINPPSGAIFVWETIVDASMVINYRQSDGTDKTFSAGSGSDANAVHVNASAEISALTEKTTPVAADLVIIEDSQATNAKKKVQLGNIPARTGVYRNEKFAAGIMTPRVTAGATFGQTEKGANKNNYDYFEFDAATAQYVQFAWRAPDVWDLSTIKVKLHWTDGATAGTGNVVWGVQAVAISDGDALDVAFGTAQEVTDAFGSTGNNHVTVATAAITIGGTPVLGDLVTIQIYRKAADVADTYTQAARLLAVDIQYKESTTIPTAW
jgi:hypothetical protein